MEIKQIYSIINTASQEVLGESALVQEDLSNIVDIGAAVFDNNSFDKFVRTLVDHIGRVVLVDRVFRGRVQHLPGSLGGILRHGRKAPGAVPIDPGGNA